MRRSIHIYPKHTKNTAKTRYCLMMLWLYTYWYQTLKRMSTKKIILDQYFLYYFNSPFLIHKMRRRRNSHHTRIVYQCTGFLYCFFKLNNPHLRRPKIQIDIQNILLSLRALSASEEVPLGWADQSIISERRGNPGKIQQSLLRPHLYTLPHQARTQGRLDKIRNRTDLIRILRNIIQIVFPFAINPSHRLLHITMLIDMYQFYSFFKPPRQKLPIPTIQCVIMIIDDIDRHLSSWVERRI